MSPLELVALWAALTAAGCSAWWAINAPRFAIGPHDVPRELGGCDGEVGPWLCATCAAELEDESSHADDVWTGR